MADKSTSKSGWKYFFSFEKELLEFLSQQKFLAGDQADLKYSETEFRNSILERPPKFLHCVISLGGEESLIQKVQADILELQNRYLTVSTKTGFPSRFPQLLKHPLQINLSQHEAFRSHVISADKDKEVPEFVQIKRYSSTDLDSLAIEDIAALSSIGFRAELHEKSFGKTLNVSVNDLVFYANAKKLTVRESSGYQYTARVRYPDGFQAVRMSYGLLIIPNDCPTLQSLPQARRAHRLETSKDKLILPIECDAEIFIKES